VENRPARRWLDCRADRARHADGDRLQVVGLLRSLADLTAPPQYLRQLGEVRRHAAGLVAREPVIDRATVRILFAPACNYITYP
jgi:hypothetical protein